MATKVNNNPIGASQMQTSDLNNPVIKLSALEYIQNNTELQGEYSAFKNKQIDYYNKEGNYNGLKKGTAEEIKIQSENDALRHVIGKVILKDKDSEMAANYHEHISKHLANFPYSSQAQKYEFIDNVSKGTRILNTKFRGVDYYKPTPTITPLSKEAEESNLINMVNFFDVVSGKVTNKNDVIKKAIDGTVTIQNKVSKGTMSIQGMKNLRDSILSAEQVIEWDTETIGGKNIHGQKTLTGLTEFSFNVFNINNGKAEFNKDNSKTNVIGISKEDEAYYKDMINRAKNRLASGPITDEEKVTLNGLFKYGYNGAGIDHLGKGVFKVRTAEENFSDILDFNALEKGLKELRNVWDVSHEIGNMTNGLTTAEQQIIDVTKMLKNKKTLLSGHNSINADMPWMNQFIYNLGSNEFRKQYQNAFGSLAFDVDPSQMVDKLPALQTIAARGDGVKYFKDVIGNMADKSKTYLANENIMSMFGLKGTGAAHNAETDALGAAKFLLGDGSDNIANAPFMKMLNSFINSYGSHASQSAFIDTTFDQLKNSNYLFRVNESIYGGDIFTENKLNFAINNIAGGYTTSDGKLIARSNNNTYAQSYGQATARKNSMATISDIGAVDITENSDTAKAIKTMYPNFSQGRLYYAELTPVYNKAVAGAEDNARLNSPYYIAARSKNELINEIQKLDLLAKKKEGSGTDINNIDNYWTGLGKVTDDSGNTVKDIDASIMGRYEKHKLLDDGTGKVETKALGAETDYNKFINNMVTDSTKYVSQESVARNVRDEKVNKVGQMHELISEVDTNINSVIGDIKSGKDISKSTQAYQSFYNIIKSDIDNKNIPIDQLVSHYKTNGYNKEALALLTKEFNKNLQAIHKVIDIKKLREHGLNAAISVANNTLDKTNIGTASFAKIAGYTFNNEHYLPQTSQVTNAMQNFNYFAQTKDLNDLILKNIDSVSKNQDWHSEDKNEAYRLILDNVKSHVAENANKDVKRRLLNNSAPAELYKQDLMYFEVNLDLNKFRTNAQNKFISAFKEDVDNNNMKLKVNLNGFNLADKLVGRLGRTNLTPEQKENMGRNLLLSFIEQMGDYKESDHYNTNLSVRDAFADFKESGLKTFNIDGKTLNTDDVSTKVLSNEVVSRLKALVNNDVRIGKETPIYAANTIDETEFGKHIAGLDKNSKVWKSIQQVISDTAQGLPTKILNPTTETINAEVSRYINHIHGHLNNLYGTDDGKEKLINEFGYTVHQAEFEQDKFKMAKKELTDYYTELLHQTTKSGLNFNIKDDGIYVNTKDQAQQAIKLSHLPTLVSDKLSGGLGIRYGNNEAALKMYLAEDKDGKFYSRTGIEEGFKTMEFSMARAFANSKDRHNEINTVQSVIQNVNKRLMENPSIAEHNLMNAGQSLVYDYKRITSALVSNKGIMKNINFKDGIDGIQERKAYENIINRIDKYGASDFDKVFGGDKEVLGGLMHQILQNVITNGNVDSDTKKYLSWLNLRYKDTHMVKGEGIIDTFGLDTWQALENEQRPNKYQIISTAYDEDNAVKSTAAKLGIEEVKARKILGVEGPSVISKMSLHRRKGKIEDKMYNTSITALNLRTSELQYKAFVNSHFAQKLESGKSISHDEEVVRQYLLNTSLHDQEGVIDARVINSIVPHNTPQYVSANKDVLIALDKDIRTTKNIEDLKGKLMPEFRLEDGQLKVVMRKQGKFVRRFDTVLETMGHGNIPQIWRSKSNLAMASLKFFIGNDVEVDENTLNKVLKEAGITGNSSNDINKAYAVLSKRFNAKFHVDNLEEATYRKMMLGYSEKGEESVLTAGLGESEYVNNVLGKVKGDKEVLGDIKLSELRGVHLSDKYIGHVAEALSPEVGLKTEDLKKALMTEKYMPSSYLFDTILGRQQQEVESKTGKRLINITAMEEAKHKTANLNVGSAINLITDAHLQKGGTLEELADKLNNSKVYTINGKNAFSYDKDRNKIFVSQNHKGGDPNSYLDVDALESLMKEYGLTGKNKSGYGTYFDAYGKSIFLGAYEDVEHHAIKEESKLTSSGLASVKLNSDLAFANKNKKLREDAIDKYTSSAKLIERGVLIGDREALMMNFTKTDTAFNLLNHEYSKLGGEDLERWKNLSKHYLNDKGEFDSSRFKDKGLMSYFTDQAKDRQFITDEDRLTGKALSKVDIDSDEYKHLSGIYKEFGNGKDISLRKAEELHGLTQNLKTVSFHNKELTLSNIMDKNHKAYLSDQIKDISEISIGQNGAAHEAEREKNNIYKNNLIVDLFGDKLKEFTTSDSERYAAIGRMPMKQYGDTVINYDFQDKLRYLQGQKAGIATDIDTYGKESSHVLNRIANYKKSIEAFKEEMNTTIQGKDGIFSNLMKVRMPMSSNGKAAGMLYLSNQDISKVGEKVDPDLANVLKRNRELFQNSAKSDMANILSAAKYDGKSLLSHYEKGNYLDVKFVSKEALGSMGLLDKKYMKALNLNSEEALLKHYATHGIAGVTNRYPTIYETSFKPTQIYYNDKLSGQKMIMNAEGVATARGDYDGDLSASFIATFGQKRMTSAQMEHLLSLDESKKADYMKYNKLEDKDIQGYHDMKLLAQYHSRGINQAEHDTQIDNAIKSTLGSSSTVRDILDERGGSLGNKYLLNHTEGMPHTREEENYYNTIFNSLKQEVIESNPNLKDDYKGLFKALDSRIANHSIASERETFRNAVSFKLIDDMTRKAELAGYKKTSIGVANIPLFADRQLAQVLFSGMEDVGQRDKARGLVQHMSTAIEQSVISMKKSDNLSEIYGKTQRFREAHNDLLLNGNREKMRNFLTNEVDFDKEIKTHLISVMPRMIGGFDDYDTNKFKNEGELQGKVIDDYLDVMARMHSMAGTEGMKNFTAAYKMGSTVASMKKTKNGIDFLTTEGQYASTMAGNLANKIKNTDDYFAEGENYHLLNNASNLEKRAKLDLIDGGEYLNSTNAKSEIREAITGVRKIFEKAAENMTGTHLALGALGIAGSFMVAAFAGGDPGPTQNQAQDMANSGYAPSDFYSVPPLADNVNQGRQQQGYVVNVKAKTNKSDNHTQQAVRNAVYQSTSTNINISMNINPSQGNISDRDIQNMLVGAFN